MNKYLLACAAALVIFSGCEKEPSKASEEANAAVQEEANSTMQEAEKWNPVENELGVDPLNEDAVDDAKALPKDETPQEEQQEDHWNDGVWTDDENNESLDVQEKITKDSIEKAKADSNSEKTDKNE